MASLSSPGIGSGLNVTQLVSQLVAAERAPQDRRIQRIDSEARSDLAAFGAIRNTLTSLRNASNALAQGGTATPARRTTVQAEAGFTATAGAGAALGRYNIEVVSLATAEKRQSAAVAAGADLGSGTLSFTVGSETFDVTLGATTTVNQLRDAINAAAGGRGLSATVVNGDAGSVLVLNAATAGVGGAVTVNASGSIADFATGSPGLAVTVPAADARVIVDGVSRNAPSNRLTDLIDGITLDLTKANSGTSYTLDIGSDNASVRSGVQAFISAYNASVATLRSVGNFNVETRQGGPLVGDSAVRGLTQQLRGAIGNAFDGLSALGIKGSKDGSLTLDTAKLDAALAADPSTVSRLFDKDQAGSLGNVLAARLEGAVAPSTGLLDSRSKALNDRLRSLDGDRERLSVRIDRFEQNYRRQFTALDGMVAQLQTTQSFLTQQLTRLAQI